MRNELHKKAIELYSALAEVLKPYVCKKVAKVTPYDSWTKEIKEKINTVESEILNTSYPRYRVIFKFYRSYVHAELTIIFNDAEAHHSYYKEVSFCVCTLEENHLVDVFHAPPLKTDYDAKIIEEQSSELSTLKARASEIESALRYFEVHR
jgi:hypothetical protein